MTQGLSLFGNSQVEQAGAVGRPHEGTPTSPATAPSPLRRLHGLLRGRYRVVTTLAAICAAGGAAAGILIPRPAVESSGMIEVKALVPSPNDWDKVMPMYNAYVSSIVAKLHSERVMKAALATPEWQARRPGAGTEGLSRFSKGLVVRYLPNTELIQLTYTDSQADSCQAAPVAIKAVIGAYKDLFADQDTADVKQKIEYWGRRERQLRGQVDDRRAAIQTWSRDFGDDLAMMVNAKLEDLVKLEATVREADGILATAQAELQAAARGAGSAAYTPEDIARVDPLMQEQLRLRTEIELEVQQDEAALGPSNPRTQQAVKILKVREQYIGKCAREVREKYFIKWNPAGAGGSLVPKDLTEIRATVRRLHDTFDREKAAVADVSGRHMRIGAAKAEIANFELELAQMDKRRQDLEYQRDMSGQFTVLSDGDSALTAFDKRPVTGAAGLLFGGALPVIGVVLLGLARPRLRYSDETDSGFGGVTLLGILPDLAERANDAEAAGVAAHCVHQIRTMLQINAGDGRRVIAVTSASPGDGKTSLTLALGLSYAACGARTLLIDCDLAGAGLTARLDIAAPEGILEAVAQRSLLPFVRATELPDVRVLPVGASQSRQASTLSPAAFERLIEEAKAHYDSILIDTGPLLGGIESPLACAVADAVVLAVSRGQDRPAIDRALAHLGTIGARLAGVVFNRAEPTDLAKSFSSPKRRPPSHSTSERLTFGIGPLAGAVRCVATGPMV